VETKLDQKHLGGALAAAGVVAIGVAFLGGCFYPFLVELMSPHTASGVRSSFSGVSPMILVDFGLFTAMIALPVTLVLIFGIGLPVFRLWIRRGYSNIAQYIGGGVIVAIIGVALIGVAHVLSVDFLIDSDFRFALLLIGICGPVAGLTVWYVLQRSGQ
jgi:hypothetical protein